MTSSSSSYRRSAFYACYIPCASVDDDKSSVVSNHTASTSTSHNNNKQQRPPSPFCLYKDATDLDHHHHHPTPDLDHHHHHPPIMKRASLSRRQEGPFSPPMRSRSSERIDERQNELLETTDAADAAAAEELEDDSERVHERSRTKSFHRRAMSDPFDFQEEGKDSIHPHQLFVMEGEVLPTLPRYPVAETRNKNCWSEPQVNIFHVRGPDYLTSKKKIPSEPYLLQARGCDLFLNNSSDSEEDPLNLETKSFAILGGRLRSKPTLLVNFRFPWGNMILYFEIPKKLTPYLQQSQDEVTIDPSLSVPEQVLAKWLLGDEAYKNERLKLIPYVAEGPFIVRNMVTGRPAIIGKRLPVTYQLDTADCSCHHPLLQCTLDIGSSSAAAKRIVSVCRRYMSALTVDVGFVIQGDSADELPEQMMGSVRVHRIDPLKAATL